MQDRVPLYPGRVTLTPVAGQSNTYDMARADQPTQEGTPLNKSTLLTDAVASMFGFGPSAVPNDMFNVLTHAGDLHVWKRTIDGVTDYPVSPNRNAYQEGTSGNTTVEYMGQLGNKVQIETGSYVGTGTYGRDNPNSLTLGFEPQIVVIGSNSSSASNASYCVLSNNGYFCPVFSGFGGGVEGVLYGVVPTFNERSVSWFSASNAVRQLNASGITYNYIALG